jgi:hypothetical protein
MSNTYSWIIKNLNSDKRGYASDIFLELQGTSPSGANATAALSVSFGGSDYKPASQWQQTDIDSLAALHQPDLQANIDLQLEGK